MRLAVRYAFRKKIFHFEPGCGNFDQCFRHIALAAFPEMKHNNATRFQPFACLPKKRSINLKTDFLPLIHKS